MEAGVPSPDPIDHAPPTVGIRDLRHDARRWVERARAGERVIITDRGRPVAELVPHRRERTFLRELYDTGQVVRARRKPRPLWTTADPVSSTLSDELRRMRDEDHR